MPDTIFEEALDNPKATGAELFEALVDSFVDDVHGGSETMNEEANKAASQNLFGLADAPGPLQQAFNERRIEPDDISFRALIDVMPRAAYDQISANRPLDETAVDALVGSEWHALFRPCLQYIFRDRTCPAAPLGNLTDCYPPAGEIPCWDYQSTVKICEWKLTPPPELDCWPQEGGLDPRPKFRKVGEYKCHQLGKPCTRDFAFAFHRSLVCGDPEGQARQQVDAHIAHWRDYIFEHERIDHIFGINGCSKGSCGIDHRVWYNDVKYDSAYLTPEDAGPWTNSITDPGLELTACNIGILRCVLTDIFEKMRDPCNCYPIVCDGELSAILPNGCQVNTWKELQSTANLLRKLTDGCSEVEVRQNIINDSFSDEVKTSRWIWDRLVEYYLNCYNEDWTDENDMVVSVGPANRIVDPVVAQQTAEFWAANTYILHKDISQATDFNIQFEETRTLGGTDHDLYFNDGITLAERYIFSYMHSWRRPEIVLRIRGFDPTKDVDGNAIP